MNFRSSKGVRQPVGVITLSCLHTPSLGYVQLMSEQCVFDVIADVLEQHADDGHYIADSCCKRTLPLMSSVMEAARGLAKCCLNSTSSAVLRCMEYSAALLVSNNTP